MALCEQSYRHGLDPPNKVLAGTEIFAMLFCTPTYGIPRSIVEKSQGVKDNSKKPQAMGKHSAMDE
jgi:hypothetical protein